MSKMALAWFGCVGCLIAAAWFFAPEPKSAEAIAKEERAAYEAKAAAHHAATFGKKPEKPALGGSIVTAWTMAKEFVSRDLKAPATARFPRFTEATIDDLGGGQFRVRAYVDSENGFGALIRTDFTCKLQYAGGDNWKLLDLQTE